MYTTLISTHDLGTLLRGPEAADTLVFDCRHRLDNPSAGAQMYREGHIPGALFASLDKDLARPATMTETGHSGRHPLPDEATWMRRLADWGLTPSKQVVVYDDSGGSIAARMWWMVRAAGHTALAVLDGGLPAWLKAGGQLEPGERQPAPASSTYPGHFRADWTVGMDQVRSPSSQYVLVDARAANRFRGEHETLDPQAGHIPGAVSMPYQENLNADGTFRSPRELRARFAPLLATAGSNEIVSYCGSGVTACHNLLAMEIAGLPTAKLFPASWSAWSRTPGLPIETG
jgi:thiosulfate/3-mercaptopyruvate sulfurtransferase